MTTAASPCDASATGYQKTYRIRNNRVHVDPPRQVNVEATPEQIRQLEDDGYMVRERLITGEHLQRLRDAVDEIAAAQSYDPNADTGRFNGLFVRCLLDKHPAFLEMLQFAPTLSVARAVIGPQVQVHAFVMRVSYPTKANRGVEWHFHQRVVPDPVPAFFFRPVVLDNLIYLDDITQESGPLCVLPGSHKRDADLPTGDLSDKEGQVVLTVPAGSVVTSHSSLWHKAMPTLPGSGIRRLLILGYSPVWMKPIDHHSVFCGRSNGGLTDTLKNSADEETRELLGLSGYY